MGNWMGSWFCRLPSHRILIGGLDAAGKTTLLYKMKIGEVVTTIPTIGFNVETVKVDGIEITCWDIGGRDKARVLVRHYLKNTHGYVYVVDSTDRERLNDALRELNDYILSEDDSRETIVMLLANKQDKEGAMSAEEVESAFLSMSKKHPSYNSHTIFVKPCSATGGEGLQEALSYFVTQLRLNAQGKAKRGVITVKERLAEAQREATAGESEITYKLLFKDPVGYLKHLIY